LAFCDTAQLGKCEGFLWCLFKFSRKDSCKCRRLRRHWFDPRVKKILWRKKRQPTPVFLLGKSYGQRSLAGYSPGNHKELDTTEKQNMHALLPWGDGSQGFPLGFCWHGWGLVHSSQWDLVRRRAFIIWKVPSCEHGSSCPLGRDRMILLRYFCLYVIQLQVGVVWGKKKAQKLLPCDALFPGFLAGLPSAPHLWESSLIVVYEMSMVLICN